jgi:hypothetical protein
LLSRPVKLIVLCVYYYIAEEEQGFSLLWDATMTMWDFLLLCEEESTFLNQECWYLNKFNIWIFALLSWDKKWILQKSCHQFLPKISKHFDNVVTQLTCLISNF